MTDCGAHRASWPGRLALLQLFLVPSFLGTTACAPDEGPQTPSEIAPPNATEGRAAVPAKLEQLGRGWHPGAPELDLVGTGATCEVLSAELARDDELHWSEERLANELAAGPLRALRSLLAGPWSAGELPAWRAVFEEGARLAPVESPGSDGERVTSGIVRRAWTGIAEAEDAATLEPEGWVAALARSHEGAHRVRWVSIQPVRIERLEGGVRARLAWRLNRELSNGSLQHDEGLWTSEWRKASEEEGWRCRLLAPREGSTLIAAAPHFVDATGDAFAGTLLDPRLPTARLGMLRGVALGDLDGDRDLDLVTTLPLRILTNRGDGTFEDRSLELLPGSHGRWNTQRRFKGVLIADFDRDGHMDVLAAGNQRPSLLLLQRDGAFRSRVLDAAHPDNLPTSLAAHDVDRDGWLDVYLCGHGGLKRPGPDRIDDADNGDPNQMLRGLPNGRFEDVTERWGLDVGATRWSSAAAFGDPDEDGDFDLYVANDFGPNVLYRRSEDEEGGVRFVAEVEPTERVEAGLSTSATWGDLDGDLDLDLYVSNASSIAADRVRSLSGDRGQSTLPFDAGDLRRRLSRGNALALDDGGVLREAGAERGGRRAERAFGTALFDYDLDGDLDVHCVNGFLSQGLDDGRDLESLWWRHGVTRTADVGPAAIGGWAELLTQLDENLARGWSWSGFQRSRLFVNDGEARFVDVGAVSGADQVSDGRGLACGDLDGDGDLDLVGTSSRTHPHVYVLRNDLETERHFVLVDLVPRDRRSPAGARLLLTAGGRTQRRDVAIGSGFLTQHSTTQHFGLGAAASVERLEITWPDGEVQTRSLPRADARFVVEQGSPDVSVVPLRPRDGTATRRLPEVEWDAQPHPMTILAERSLDLSGLWFDDLDGGRHTLIVGTKGFRRDGPALLLHLWATTSAASEREMPVLVRAHAEGRAGLRVIGISLDDEDEGARVARVATEWGVGFPVAHLTGAKRAYLLERLEPVLRRQGGLALPLSLLMSPAGRVIAVARGGLDVDGVTRFLQAFRRR